MHAYPLHAYPQPKWEWPKWIGAGTANPYQNVSKPAHYVMQWIRGANSTHGLQVDFVGVWNENACNPEYVLALRNALDSAGFSSTKIVAPDTGHALAAEFIQQMLQQPELAAATHAVGFHYPNSNPGVPADVQAKLQTPLWASEDDSTVDPPASAPPTPRPRQQPGGGCLVRTINQNYVQGNITATIVWNLIMARYPQLRWDYTGLIAATDPFGGHYDVLPPVWAAAHTTQFTKPGWKLLQVGHGSGWLHNGGTYVGYASGDQEDHLSIVIEKMDDSESKCQRGSRTPGQLLVAGPENATFDLQGRAAGVKSLAVWRSHFGSGENETAAELFVAQADVLVVNGSITIELLPNHAYTLSTVRTASKGQATPHPSSSAFPAQYSDDFDGCVLSSIPKYVAPMAGAFDCVTASGGRTGHSVRQASPAKAICDRGDAMPFAIIGDGFRTTYNVSIDVLLPAATVDGGSSSSSSSSSGAGEGAFLGARVKGPVGSCSNTAPPINCSMDGVLFAINTTAWHVALKIGDLGGPNVVASGPLPPPSLASSMVTSGSGGSSSSGVWRRMTLSVSGTTAQAAVDNVIVAPALVVPAPRDHFTGEVANVVVNLGKGGYAAFGTVGYANVEFDNLNIASAP
jgi:galactosylceramidase